MFRRIVGVLVAAVVGLGATALPAQAVTVYPTSLTLNAKPEPVAVRGTVTLAGSLKYKKAGRWVAPSAGKAIAVWFDPAGTAKPVKIATVKTNTKGAYTYKHSQSRSGTWIVKYAGQRNLAADRAADYVRTYVKGPWNYPGPDLDCPDIGKMVWVGSNDYHDLDRDGDGWGCDSYA
ncbi:hypothetical protein ACH436_13370 [Isoptericola sp. NPDC019693]|uniref:hypothetical protein n=1 Tax=Isoptericola sp. NPDC019693 TaxID=3364009 RepID=UPI00379561BE